MRISRRLLPESKWIDPPICQTLVDFWVDHKGAGRNSGSISGDWNHQKCESGCPGQDPKKGLADPARFRSYTLGQGEGDQPE
jgi:hypothetical protein